MTGPTWITPIEAGLLIASHHSRQSILDGHPQTLLMNWIRRGKIAAMAMEASRYTPDLPSSGETMEDYIITAEDWMVAFDEESAIDLQLFVRSGEASFGYIDDDRVPNRVVFSGIRLAREDVDRQMKMAGWPIRDLSAQQVDENSSGTRSGAATLRDESTETSAKPAAMPAAAWSEADIDAAIASCGYTNRDTAWREFFKPKRSEHGWDVEAFRSRWSTARNTKGLQGRPSGS